MFRIEYEIGLNESGRPCIELPLDYKQNPEDRFFAIEIARYILQDVHGRRTNDLNQQTIIALRESSELLGQLGDEIAEILYGSMRASGEAAKMFHKDQDIIVETLEERDALPDKDILFNDKIYDREEGLKVLVHSKDNYLVYNCYELVDGITNEHWVKQ
jgi:hypothetical protein